MHGIRLSLSYLISFSLFYVLRKTRRI